MGTSFILRIESSLGFWSARVTGNQIEKRYIPFGSIVCA